MSSPKLMTTLRAPTDGSTEGSAPTVPASQRQLALRDERARVKMYLERTTQELVRQLQETQRRLNGNGEGSHVVDSDDDGEEATGGDSNGATREEGSNVAPAPAPAPPANPTRAADIPGAAALPTPIRALLHRLQYPRKSIATVKKFVQILRVMEELHKALTRGTVVTKRDIYYHSPVLFGSQSVVDRIVDDITALFEVRRSSLGVVAASKGLVAGAVSMALGTNEELLDASHLREMLIPDVETIERMICDRAKWLLVVEKEAVFKTLLEEKMTQGNDRGIGQGVIVTGKGYPDLLTRDFVVRFALDCPGVPIFALVDADPFGLHIFQQYQQALVEARPRVRQRVMLLGLLSEDIPRFGVQPADLIPLQPIDCKKAESMLKALARAGDDHVRHELLTMIERSTKAEIECLSSHRGNQPTKNGIVSYLQSKLQEALQGPGLAGES